jgi:hypothetical protein
MNPLSHIILEIDRLLEDFPELADDEQLRLDTIEGETDALEIATRLVRLVNRADAMAKAIDDEAKALATRKARYVAQKDRGRDSLKSLMRAADLRKLELPVGTVSLRATGPALVITGSQSYSGAVLDREA